MRETDHQSGRDTSLPQGRLALHVQLRVRRERGAIAIMTAFVLLVILGFYALALDLPRVFNRRAEMQTLADTVAITAAKKLNGTPEGITAALAAARAVVEDASNGPKYEYANKITWDNAAIKFGSSRTGGAGWKSDTQASASPAGLMYVKVDTAALPNAYGRVGTLFAPILSSTLTAVDVGYVTIAGKGRLYVTPLAICAMSATAYDKRANPAGTTYDELVEYGFRRGVSYDLMQLNPGGKTPVNFQVDPIALAGSGNSATNFQSWAYEPYLCTGTMSVPKVTGATVSVQSPFPIASYYNQLNSRFDPYTGSCDIHTSPPDSNVKQYPAASVSWMTKKSSVQSALPYTPPAPDDNILQTVADKGPPNHPAAADYGTLWAYSRAIPWSSYTAQGAPEPAAGYTPFDATDLVWQKLYGSDSDIGTYPAATPYFTASGSSYTQSPPTTARKPGTMYRRVLNVPLLSCPVSGASAQVLAVAKFFMTIPATSSAIHAEFGGITTDDWVGGPVEIYK